MSDAARRCADIINGYIHSRPWDELKDCVVAIRLSDGGSDGVLYDNKGDAVRHQLTESQCAYVCFRNLAQGIQPIEAERYLDYNRRAYDAGYRLPDPDAVNGGPELFLSVEDHDTMVRNHARRYLLQAIHQIPPEFRR